MTPNNSPSGDLRAIACNVATVTPAYSRGSLAYVVQLAGDRVHILVRSRGSRWVQFWVPINDLANFR